MKSVQLKIKLLDKNATIPTRGSEEAAGYDLYSAEEKIVQPGTVEKISTGIAMELPQYTFGAIYPRSGLSTKQGLRLANCVGVCDSDYRGPYIVALYNDSCEPQQIHIGDRIAQFILTPYIPVDSFLVSQDLSETERGEGGFGSTGT